MFICAFCLLAADDAKTTSTKTKSAPTASEATYLADDFLDNLQGEFILDPLHLEKLGKFTVPTLSNGDWQLSAHPKSLVEAFAARTKTDASIYVKMGDHFVIVSTSLKGDKNGGGALGVVLDQASPAHQSLMKGKRYTGQAVLFDKTYMADFDLIRDAEGNVLGAYFVGIPIQNL